MKKVLMKFGAIAAISSSLMFGLTSIASAKTLPLGGGGWQWAMDQTGCDTTNCWFKITGFPKATTIVVAAQGREIIRYRCVTNPLITQDVPINVLKQWLFTSQNGEINDTLVFPLANIASPAASKSCSSGNWQVESFSVLLGTIYLLGTGLPTLTF